MCCVVLVLHLFESAVLCSVIPKGWFESSALPETAKFLNPSVVRNQPHHIFLQFAFAAMLKFYLFEDLVVVHLLTAIFVF